MAEERICGTCKHWELQEHGRTQYEGAEGQTIVVGECQRLNNDFCCYGHKDDEPAGCTGGGGFQSIASFGCILWETK